MAKKSDASQHNRFRPDRSKDTDEVPWGGFIDIRLTEEMKQEFARWLNAEPSAVWEEFVETLGQGLKFSLSWDKENECFVASFVGSSGSLSGWRYALTARSDIWEKAIHLLVFKHVVLLEKDWGRFKPRTFGVEI
jgi:hypothetical protein